jgi:hypothetical protein
MPDQCIESILNQFTKTVITLTNNYHGIPLLLTSFKILSNIFLSRLSPYIDEIIGDHLCRLRHNGSTTDQIFCIHLIPDKKWKYKETVHQIFTDLQKASDSLMTEVLNNILMKFAVPMKLVWLINICLNETYSRVCIGKHFSDSFPIQNGLKQRDALSPLLFNFALKYTIRSTKIRWD